MEVILVTLFWSLCSMGMTILNKKAVVLTNTPLSLLLLQMIVSSVLVLITGKVKIIFSRNLLYWIISIPTLFLTMLTTSMIALKSYF